jgi:hypothetical protein
MTNQITKRFIFFSRVRNIEKKKKSIYKNGIGNETIFEEKDLGYFLNLEGSFESLFVGMESLNWPKGRTVKVTIELVDEEAKNDK